MRSCQFLTPHNNSSSDHKIQQIDKLFDKCTLAWLSPFQWSRETRTKKTEMLGIACKLWASGRDIQGDCVSLTIESSGTIVSTQTTWFWADSFACRKSFFPRRLSFYCRFRFFVRFSVCFRYALQPNRAVNTIILICFVMFPLLPKFHSNGRKAKAQIER